MTVQVVITIATTEFELEVASRAAVSELARSVCFAIGQGLARGEECGTGMSVSCQRQSASPPSGGRLAWRRRERAGRAGGRACGGKALAWMEGGSGGGEAPPRWQYALSEVERPCAGSNQVLSEKLNLDLKLERVSWQGQWA